MGFAVGADAYSRFMGRYSRPLAPLLADLAGVGAGQRVLDVGCGPGALTDELVRRVGPGKVSAVDPSASLVDALGRTQPGVDVRLAAEALPYEDGTFDAALAQLVVRVHHPSFEEWWEPFTLGVGPSGEYVTSLDPAHADALANHARTLLPPPPFHIDAVAWSARAPVPTSH